MRLTALDGVRGIAIVMVLTSHSWLSSNFDFWPHLGWSGVELFFVLSGFLITSVLLDAKASSRAYFRPFYARRILRIFPLYYVVIAVAFLMAEVLPTAHAPQLGIPDGQHWTYWVFLSNVSMAAVGVFSLSAAGVTWSLAVEEQFYALWAPIVRFLERRLLGLLCLALCVVAAAWRFALYGTHGWTLAGLVLLPSQMDALAAGALVATISRDDVLRSRTLRLAPWILAVSVAGLFLSALRVGTFYSESAGTWVISLSLYPLLYASTLALVVFKPESGLVGVLRVPILRTYGRYSYAIYLLHRPILIGMNLVGLNGLALPSSPLGSQLVYTTILMVASLIAGWLSWCLLEQPLQRLRTLVATSERGKEHDAYVLGGYRTMFTFGPWKFERPELSFGVRDAVGHLRALKPSPAFALLVPLALSLLAVFLVGRDTSKVTLPIDIVLLAGACGAVLLSVHRATFVPAATVILVSLLATPHGPLVTAIGMIVLIPILLKRLALQRIGARPIESQPGQAGSPGS